MYILLSKSKLFIFVYEFNYIKYILKYLQSILVVTVLMSKVPWNTV